jgi:epidermal growth factor receptor substrate 15
VSTQAAELAGLQTQLASAKAAYETEVRLLGSLRERYGVQQAEITAARTELITAESDLSAHRAERAEVEGALLRDKEEVRALQRRMKEVGTEADVLKLEAEKGRKEAKQQKGLLAIARKQLAAREAERAKAEQECTDAHAEAATLALEREAAEVELTKDPEALVPAVSPPVLSPTPAVEPPIGAELLAASTQPLPLSPDVTGLSPMHTGASAASNNPFARLAGSTPRSQSPFLPFTNAPIPTPGSAMSPLRGGGLGYTRAQYT